MSEDTLFGISLGGAVLLLLLVLLCLSAYDTSLQRDCREKLVQQQPTRSAADITQICN
jgi:hypothetical protein